MEYQAVEKIRAYEAIVEQIENQLTDGILQVGQQLPSERVMAENFGVSRVVVREALRYLESRGLIEVRQGSGTYVREPRPTALRHDLTLLLQLEESSLIELYEVRQALEVVAAVRATQYATDDEVQAMKDCLDAMEVVVTDGVRSYDEYRAFIHLDEKFHLQIADAAQNQPLATLLRAVVPLTSEARSAILKGSQTLADFSSSERLRVNQTEHTDMWRAIRNRDARAAELFVYRHMQRSMATWDHRS